MRWRLLLGVEVEALLDTGEGHPVGVVGEVEEDNGGEERPPGGVQGVLRPQGGVQGVLRPQGGVQGVL